jgi:peptide/nickel transport system substrate-binding protein
MKIRIFRHIPATLMTLLLVLHLPLAPEANAEPVHGIAMHGEPELPPDYTHFPYANPDAPKGGSITYGVRGTYDSLNPFIVKSIRTTARGSWDATFGRLTFESLLFRNRDEPFSLYGLLAEKVEWPDDRKWIEFTLNEKAKWSDGTPVTVEDIIFSFDLLGEKGKPNYRNYRKKIDSIVKTGPEKVRFNFNDEADREFPMIIAVSPILPKHATNVETFDQTTLQPMIGSGPYVMDEIEPGKFITYRRNPDYWGEDLPSRQGFGNFDKVTIEYFRTDTTMFEAFKKGIIDVYPEGSPSAWLRDFDFPAVKSGDVVKDVFKLEGTPAPLQGFVFNTRRKVFEDRNVRKALAMLFDFEWINRSLYYGAYQRTASFWHGSELSAYQRPVGDIELDYLKPFPDAVSPEVLNGTYKPQESDGTGRDRKVMRKAYGILVKAGFKRNGSTLYGPDGTPFSFEILTQNAGQEKLAISYRRTLEKLGMQVSVRTVDSAQYQRRTQSYDYDMVIKTYSASLSPGIEQIWRWGSRSRDVEGTFNFAGSADPAIDAMINNLLQAREKQEFVAAVRAYDRVLMSGHYIVPLYHTDEQWVARRNYIKRPEKTSLYGYQFETWWDDRATSN